MSPVTTSIPIPLGERVRITPTYRRCELTFGVDDYGKKGRTGSSAVAFHCRLQERGYALFVSHFFLPFKYSAFDSAPNI